jgi:hypothetical protein
MHASRAVWIAAVAGRSWSCWPSRQCCSKRSGTIPEIARSMLDNEDGYLFASITASYKCKVDFVPSSSAGSIGELTAIHIGDPRVSCYPNRAIPVRLRPARPA